LPGKHTNSLRAVSAIVTIAARDLNDEDWRALKRHAGLSE